MSKKPSKVLTDVNKVTVDQYNLKLLFEIFKKMLKDEVDGYGQELSYYIVKKPPIKSFPYHLYSIWFSHNCMLRALDIYLYDNYLELSSINGALFIWPEDIKPGLIQTVRAKIRSNIASTLVWEKRHSFVKITAHGKACKVKLMKWAPTVAKIRGRKIFYSGRRQSIGYINKKRALRAYVNKSRADRS